MTSSSPGAAGSWRGDVWASEPDPEFSQEPLERDAVLVGEAVGSTIDLDHTPDDWGPAEDASYWHQTHEAAARPPVLEGAAGLSGRGLVMFAALGIGGCALLNMVLTGGRVTFFFDLCFVVLCLTGTMAVSRRDLFTAGVLPPLAYGAAIAVLAVAAPHAFDTSASVDRVFLTGLADHAAGLVGGYVLALLAIAARMSAEDHETH